jgi:hypothetical protein
MKALQRAAEQERSGESMATYPGRVVKASFVRGLAMELDDYKAALERIAQYPQTREEELSPAGLRDLARKALAEWNSPAMTAPLESGTHSQSSSGDSA